MDIPEQRRQRILERLAADDRISVNALAAELGVSRETVRRDLNRLAGHGLLRKVHGGAVQSRTAVEASFHSRMMEQREAKQRIAERAAQLFSAGDSLLIDTGTTTVAFAAELAKVSGLVVVTNSVAVADRVARGPGDSAAYLLGGRYGSDNSETLGPLALEQLAAFQADFAVITVGAVHEARGFMDYNVEEATMAQAMIARARATVVLADHGKFERTALIRVCPLAAAAKLVTDRAPSPDMLAALEGAGVEIIVV